MFELRGTEIWFDGEPVGTLTIPEGGTLAGDVREYLEDMPTFDAIEAEKDEAAEEAEAQGYADGLEVSENILDRLESFLDGCSKRSAVARALRAEMIELERLLSCAKAKADESGAETAVPVLFRKDKDGPEITAVFPTLPADPAGRFMVCYAHVGQHGACAPEWMEESTVPATLAQASWLRNELESAPYHYRLRIYSHVTERLRIQFQEARAALAKQRAA